MLDNRDIERAKTTILEADTLLITAGAGMGVDSGLPDFRGNYGMWREYPLLKDKNITFIEIANPKQFKENPNFAWGFYGHRFDLYRETEPNRGFEILKRTAEAKRDYFIITSNVDGHFQKAGFDENKIYEIHGRINMFQCSKCNLKAWKVPEDLKFSVDKDSFKMVGDIPKCPVCNSIARPNILMFNDSHFEDSRSEKQNRAFDEFMDRYTKFGKKMAIIEIGAGLAVPTIQDIGNYLHKEDSSIKLIRINPRDYKVPKGAISISKRGVEVIEDIFI